MTVIAWDGRYLAADTRETLGYSGIAQAPKTKIICSKSVAYASEGRIHHRHLLAMISWWQEGADPARMPFHGHGEGKDAGMIVVVGKDQQCALSYVSPYAHDLIAPWACGCGCDYAIGAMECGVAAMEAVRIACKHDSRCAEPIDFIDTEFLEKGVQRWDGLMPSAKLPMPMAFDPDTGERLIWPD
jgi:hypothetical protein